MDKTIEQIFRTFNHIVREIQIYFLSGIVVLLNIYLVDFFYYNQSLYNHVAKSEFVFPIIIISYVIGHVCMALFYCLLEITKLDKEIEKMLCLEAENIRNDKMAFIYIKNKDAYIHFIERYANLVQMRWSLSAALFINFIIDSCYLFHECFWQIRLLTIISFLSSCILLILSLFTQRDQSDKIVAIENILNSQEKTDSTKGI